MKKRLFLYIVICLMLFGIGMVLSLAKGGKSIPFDEVLYNLFKATEGLDKEIIRNGRLPRAICAALVGGFLGLSGGMMQGVTRNSLAEPGVMGITQGATLSVAIISCFSGIYNILENGTAALLGGLISGLLILIFTMKSKRNKSTTRLLLAGSAMGIFFISLASLLALLTNRSQELAFWVAGGFVNAGWSDVWLLTVVGGTLALVSCILSYRINIVSLGEEISLSLGENPDRVRLSAFLLFVPICSICVSVAGNIGFVGLIVPHIVNRLISRDYRFVIPLSFLTGAMLLVWADFFAKTLSAPYETPVGLFTAMLGVPFFLYLVRKEMEG